MSHFNLNMITHRFFFHESMNAEQSFESFIKKTIQGQSDNRGTGQGIRVSIKLLDGNAEQVFHTHPKYALKFN